MASKHLTPSIVPGFGAPDGLSEFAVSLLVDSMDASTRGSSRLLRDYSERLDRDARELAMIRPRSPAAAGE